MSRLKELRLHGFKSFADPTRFVFEPGVNAVIGPNGSGKSNMADAVRWVLGEQSNRSLRTRRADDVIFAGSEQRKAQGMAEAVLTLDNGDGWLPIDFAEVSIGRRAYRSGDSEYLVNGARARLRDVVDLLGEGRLGANELVVVGQGTVDAALSLRPEERRQLFEEAAGVKGLQVRRNEASGRLAKALDNLTRVSDLIAELKPQVRRLALQAEHQTQHDTLGARARGLVIASHRRREQGARAALGEARRAAAAAESALAAFRESQDAGRLALTAAEERYWRAEEAARSSGRAREATRERVIRAEGRLEALDARLRELSLAMERETADLAAAQTDLGATDEEALGAVTPAVARAAEAEDAWRAAVADLAAADGQGALGALHRHRLGERRQHGGQLRLDRLELREQAGVVERQRGTPGEHLGELEVLGVVVAPRAGGHQQRQRSQSAPACAQRDDDRRADLQAAQPLEVGVVLGQGAQQVVADALGEERLLGDADVARIERLARRERRRDLLAHRPGGAHRQAPHLAAADRIDDADVGDRRHEQVVQRRDRVLEAARAVGDLGGRGEHREASAVAGRAGAVARREHGDRRDRDADEDPLDVGPLAEVVVPDAAGCDGGDRDRPDERDVARLAEQRDDEWREHDESDEDDRRADRDVERCEHPRDRQSCEKRDRAAAVPGR